MPRDTVWINNTGGYFIVDIKYLNNGCLKSYIYNETYDGRIGIQYAYNPKNSPLADSILLEFFKYE